jgi:predicted ATPase
MRLRAIDERRFVLAAKYGKGAARGEDEIVLTDERAAAWFFKRLEDRVEKTRYRLDGWEVDVFEPPLQNLVVAEIERDRPVAKVRFPAWMSDPVEVTDSLSSRAFARIATEIRNGVRQMPADPRRLVPARIPVIVITGGPCSGKTSVMNGLKAIFKGRVHFLPETASIVIGQAGISPLGRNEHETAAYQRTIYAVQRAFEEGAMLQAELNGAYALAVDRGTLDGAAYMKDLNAWETANRTIAPLECDRYAAVIFLEQPGRKAFMAHRAENPNRYETSYEEAVETANRTRNAWLSAAGKRMRSVAPCASLGERTKVVAGLIRDIVGF